MANVMRIIEFSVPEMPSQPLDPKADDYNFELEKYKEGLRRATQQRVGNQDNIL